MSNSTKSKAQLIIELEEMQRQVSDQEERILGFERIESRLVEAQRIAGMGDFTWEVETGNASWSEGMYDLLGYDKSEKIDFAKVNAEIHHPDDLERITNWLKECLDSGKSHHPPNEYRLIRKDGKVLNVQTSVSVKFKDGKPIEMNGTCTDITESKQAEEALRESETRFREMNDLMPEAVFETDLDLNLTYANKKAFELCGYSKEDLENGLNGLSLITPEDHERAKANLGRRLKGEKLDSNEYTCLRKGGERFPILLNLTPAMKGDELCGFRGIIVDISKIKATEYQLKVSEQKYRTLVDNILQGVVIAQSDPVRLGFVNPAMATITGYEQDELLAMDERQLPMLIHEDDRQRFFGNFQKRLQGENASSQAEYRIVKKDGTTKWMSVQSSLIDYFGEPATLTIFTDITERKQAEDALQESEEKHRTLFETMIQGVVYQSSDGSIVSVNNAAERILGLTLDQMQGRTSMDPQWKSIHEDGSDFPGDSHPAMTALKTGKVVSNVVMGVFNPKIGTHTWINIDAVPHFKPGENKPYQVYTTFEDITERKLVEEAIIELKEFNESIVTNLAEGIIIESEDGVIQFANPAMSKMLGYKEGELVGEHWKCFVPDDQVETVKKANKRREHGESDQYEMELLRKDGEKINVLVGGVPQIQGTAYKGLLAAFTDITERKRAEAALLESEEKYRSLFDKMLDAFALHEIVLNKHDVPIDYTFIEVNKAFEDQTGLVHDKINGKRVTEVIPGIEDDPANWIEVYGKVAQTGEEIRFEQYSEGIEKWFSVLAFSPRKNYFATIFADITERKQAEEALRKSESRHMSMVANISDVIGIIGVDGLMIYKSPNIEKWFGWKPEDLVGIDGWVTVHPDDLERIQKEFYTLLEKDKSVTTVEYRYKCKDGHYTWIELTASNLIHDPIIGGVLLNYHDITERKQAEEELADSERQLSALVKQSPIAYEIYRDDGVQLSVNAAYEQMWGMKAEDSVGKFNVRTDPQVETLGLKPFVDKAYSGESVKLPEFEWDPRKSGFPGRARWLSTRIYPILDEQNAVMNVVINHEDITERKKAEEALWESEENYKITLKNLQVGVMVHSKDGSVLFSNPEASHLLGLTDEQILGKELVDPSWNFVNEDLSVMKVENYPVSRVITTQQKLDYYQVGVKTKDRDYITWAMVFANPVFSDNELDKIIVNFVNITERKQAEEALRKSEVMKTAMVSNIGDVIVIIDQNGINQYKSPNVTKLFGWTPEELVGKSTLDNVHPDDLEAAQELLGKIASVPDATGTTELRYKRKDGSYVWIEITIVNLLHNKDIQGILGNYQDITERKQAEEKQKELQQQLNQAQKMESVGRLAGGVAHDFNNMLGVILGHAELVINDLSERDPLRESLVEIRKAANRSADITRQLLAFARKQTVSPKVLDLNETLKNMLKMLQRLIGEDVNLKWIPGRKLKPVKIDPSQIDQLLMNLCVNARDAIGHNIGKLTLETEIVSFDDAYCADHAGFVPGDFVMLAVSDDGCGMDKGTLSNIFEPFFTSKGVGEGTGLGLATVYGIVKQNNGFINVYSELNQGTTFKIYLPQYIGKDVPSAVTEDSVELAKGSKETILVVEDEPAILKLTIKLLKRLGYRVLTASTPGEAIEVAEAASEHIDLLMTDVVMPEMNGRDLAKNLLVLYPNLKRLFMSGYTANVIAHHGVLDVGVHFIQKPFKLKDLAIKVREALA